MSGRSPPPPPPRPGTKPAVGPGKLGDRAADGDETKIKAQTGLDSQLGGAIQGDYGNKAITRTPPPPPRRPSIAKVQMRHQASTNKEGGDTGELGKADQMPSTSELDDPQLAGNVLILQQLGKESCHSIALLAIEYLEQPDTEYLLSQLGEVATSTGVGFKPLQSCIRAILVILRFSLQHMSTPSELEQQFIKLGVGPSCATIFRDLWEKKSMSLFRSLSHNVFNVNQLVDIDWKFGFTIATDKVENMSVAFLQLFLTIAKGDGVTERVNVELTLAQFYQFLAAMKDAKTHLDCS
mmetsp:Transcript_7769/g.12548  ORF Transcript_7769/g.12548 Transcript_7769/m.12548 type:complete len:295 (-) Transcript_7769:239-1123(-)|eukprot:CAMPEP_0203746082 /NCGR_PEP_ID=MMETSP0098-20131031/1630_1 /ASSEMBLY_ACC=CAM_ASM_000208 /TAXON_ID=96639 /ORGANISM=" , Strain NY0313808BC1" /LENGTH=294 /DNA_ID=CAMNT_0050634053 /DNA_START=281 /DNA_END=1165 /DNA_ORIENTATION=+